MTDPASSQPPAPPEHSDDHDAAVDPFDDGFEAAEAAGADETLIVDLDGFEGPLDLLLALARAQKLDLTKMSMVDLADQYLSHIGALQRMRLEVAADYLVMAAWLTFLKSKMLLPVPEEAQDGPTGEELAAYLAFRLKRLEAMRDRADMLMDRKRLGRDVFVRGMPEGVRLLRSNDYEANVYDLLAAYARQRQTTAVHSISVRQRSAWSIKTARERIERVLGAMADWAPLEQVLLAQLSAGFERRTALASGLCASLELSREGALELRQAGPYAPVYFKAKTQPRS